jgi:predicted transcriptional regulator
MELLQHVWELGQASVADVHARVLQDREVAYTTVMTILRKLVDKGYLEFEKKGNAYVYSAKRAPDSVRGSVLSEIIDKVFRGSPVELVQTLTRQEELSDEDLEEIRKLIDQIGGEAGEVTP